MASRKLEVVFVGDTGPLEKSFKGVEGGSKRAETRLEKMGKALAGAFAVEKVAQGAKFAVSAATDLGEEVSKTSVVFRGSEKDLLNWSKTTASSLGISRRAALEATATFGNMLVPMGFARKEAAGMSKKLVGLAADMASFNNANPEETLDAIRAGLSGETEPLRRFGVFLNEARVKAQAMSMGLVKATKDTDKIRAAQLRADVAQRNYNKAVAEHGRDSDQARRAKAGLISAEAVLKKAMKGSIGELTAAQKAQATYSLIMKDTKDAQGDFARTSDSLANQQRVLKAQMENLAASIGQALLPAAQKIAQIAVWLLTTFQRLPGPVQTTIGVLAGLAVGASALGMVLGPLGVGMSAIGTAATFMAAKVTAAMTWIRGGALLTFGPWILAIGAVIAAGVLLYKNWDIVSAALAAAWDWIKGAAQAAFSAVTSAISSAWEAIKGATSATWDAITGALGAVFDAIKLAVTTYFNIYKSVILGAWEAIKGAGEALWNGIKAGLAAAWDGIKAAVSLYFLPHKLIVLGAWEAIKAGGETLWNGIKTTLSTVWNGIKTTATTLWAGIKTAIVSPISGAVEGVAGLVDDLKDKLGGGFEWIKKAAGKLGDSLKEKIIGAVEGAANMVLDFVNKILGVVDKIPGVDVGRIKGLAQGGSFSQSGVQALAEGGLVSRPTVVMGEEAPRHPEFVIPTNPAYRGRALSLLSQAAQALGVDPPALPASVMRQGSVKGALSREAVGGGPLDWVKGGLDLLTGGASAVLKLLPNPADMLPEWLRGLGGWVVDKVGGWIKKKVADLLPGGDGGKPGGASGLLSGAMAIARSFGLAITSTTGGQHAPGSWHYKGRAFDASNGFGPTSEMMAFARYMAANFGSRLLELFYDPLGWSVKNGARVGWTPGGHSNHVHVAMAQGGVAPGGWVRVGELGAEWAQLPAGTRVQQASESSGFSPGGGPLIGELHVHERVDERVLARELAWAIQTGGR